MAVLTAIGTVLTWGRACHGKPGTVRLTLALTLTLPLIPNPNPNPNPTPNPNP